MLPIAAVGMYPLAAASTALLRTHREPAAASGLNSHIWLDIPTLITNPPNMYSLFPTTAEPPGTVVVPGVQGSEVRVTSVSATGLYTLVSVVPPVPPPALPPTTMMTG